MRQCSKLFVLAAMTLTFASGCERNGSFERMGERTDEAVDDAADSVEDAADDVEDAVD